MKQIYPPQQLFHGKHCSQAANHTTKNHTTNNPTNRNRQITSLQASIILAQIQSSLTYVNMLNKLQLSLKFCKAQNLFAYENKQQALTLNHEILQTLNCETIDFLATPVQIQPSTTIKCSKEKTKLVDSEITKPLENGSLCYANGKQDNFFLQHSPPKKKNEKLQLILNLKFLDQFLDILAFQNEALWHPYSLRMIIVRQMKIFLHTLKQVWRQNKIKTRGINNLSL